MKNAKIDQSNAVIPNNIIVFANAELVFSSPNNVEKNIVWNTQRIPPTVDNGLAGPHGPQLPKCESERPNPERSTATTTAIIMSLLIMVSNAKISGSCKTSAGLLHWAIQISHETQEKPDSRVHTISDKCRKPLLRLFPKV